ncbi:O-antigen ligase family protein [Planomonospora corallina]|uniref:O-antigen ligase family protein n=1 Tax=Planomonospora corallina TaxID=1806052 RepID=A0ABV8I3K1_9ACTN
MATVTPHRPRSAGRAARELPVWPLRALFVFYPLWWVLGLAPFAGALFALPMVAALARRGRVAVPRGFGLWLLFLLSVAVAGTQLDSAPRLAGLLFRMTAYASATVVFVYVYNCSSRRLPVGTAVGFLVAFWIWVVAGGYLGVLFPEGSIVTPMERVMPGAIASNELVQELVHPKFAEVQHPWGAAEPFVRPSAPFPYTNAWGSHYALLLPLVLLFMRIQGTIRQGVLLGLLATASLVPAFATLNRGMLLAVAFALSYAALRYAARGHLAGLVAMVAAGAVGGTVAYLTGVADGITSRTSVSGSNDDRVGIYLEAFQRTLDSPILGYGAPRPSLTIGVSVGTQGQFWNVMFSYGFPALLLFSLFLAGLAWRTRRLPLEMVWLHVVPVMAVFMMFYYGLDGTQLVVVFMAAALGLRHLRELRHQGAPEARP